MQIFYINLDSDLIKNEQMQFTLSSLGLNESTQRFPGILANKPLHGLSNSETGCLLSHQQLLSNLSNHHSTIIFEDDVILNIDFVRNIERLLDLLNASEMDLIFLGQTVPMQDFEMHSKLINYLKKFEINNSYQILDASYYCFD